MSEPENEPKPFTRSPLVGGRYWVVGNRVQRSPEPQGQVVAEFANQDEAVLCCRMLNMMLELSPGDDPEAVFRAAFGVCQNAGILLARAFNRDGYTPEDRQRALDDLANAHSAWIAALQASKRLEARRTCRPVDQPPWD